MRRIITISREFGSGGRELGKRLADALGIPCYDHEIIKLIAKENGFDERYVANMSERSIDAAYPLTIGHRFALDAMPVMEQPIRVAVSQREILENFAKQGDCVIVGRCADVILEAYHPLNIFVYADMAAKIARCQERAPEGENLTVKELERRIRQVEKGRRQFREMYSEIKWGEKEAYHLCINTSGREIKSLVPALVSFVECWFGPGEE
ncbi:MAG: cytidylate kinase-like family protein [Oscillospiraceae bacterium]|jgi:cytidylate kinase|nr:cytidylate kinase-like family protein [Oscillospiraceae bacterium]